MRRLVKFLHTIGAIGLMGSMATLTVLMHEVPPTTALAGYALIYGAMAKIVGWIFLPALACGSVPTGFVFAAIGHLGQSEPAWAFALSAIVPILLWLAAARVLRR